MEPDFSLRTQFRNLVLAGLVTYFSFGSLLSLRKQIVKNHLADNLPSIIESRLEEIGLSSIGLPRIVFDNGEKTSPNELGLYSLCDQTVYLRASELSEPGTGIPGLFTQLGTDAERSSIEYVTAHEYGHHFTHHLAYSHSLDFFFDRRTISKEEAMGTFLVSEGIAECFGLGTSSAHPCPTSIEANVEVYEAARGLVAPIVEVHGENGILCLLANPPGKHDLSDLKSYQARILGLLE